MYIAELNFGNITLNGSKKFSRIYLTCFQEKICVAITWKKAYILMDVLKKIEYVIRFLPTRVFEVSDFPIFKSVFSR